MASSHGFAEGSVAGFVVDRKTGDRGLPFDQFDRKFRDRHSIAPEA